MKTLQDNIILYDEDCPLCQVYTSGFLKTKMLDKNGRKPFHKISKDEEKFIDINKASDEIALVDTKTKKVTYGIDSLLKVLGYSFPWIEKIGQLKPMHYGLKKLYSFISYNRKVIIPSVLKPRHKLQCIPSFNIKYRILYILFTVLITTIVLFNFSKSISFLPQSSMGRETILAFGQILFQSFFLINHSKKDRLNYIGNLMTVSLMGSIILLPSLIINNYINISETILMLWFSITVIIMFFEHFRRVNLLKLPKHLTFTWLVYRLIILPFLINS